MTGRSRFKTHGGIPHGSTLRLGERLDFYLQWNNGVSAARWDDQSVNSNHAAQGTAGQQATPAEGGLDFERDNANDYYFTQVDISNAEGFTFFIVLKFETTSSNSCILGMNTAAHFLEFKGGADTMRCKLAHTTTEIAPGDGTRNDFSTGSKMVVTLQRVAGEEVPGGNFNIWKNGALLEQNEQANNAADGEFSTLGVRSGDRYFDGIIYDVIFTSTGGAIDNEVTKIHDYLMAKHGITQ